MPLLTVWRTTVSFGMSSEALGDKFDKKAAARAFMTATRK
jgi:hypothetical protein